MILLLRLLFRLLLLLRTLTSSVNGRLVLDVNLRHLTCNSCVGVKVLLAIDLLQWSRTLMLVVAQDDGASRRPELAARRVQRRRTANGHLGLRLHRYIGVVLADHFNLAA